MADRDEKGKFLPGNKIGPGRVKGSRNELTKRLLERFAIRNQDGISIEEIMFDVAQDDMESTENRLKAAFKLADLVFPKTAQVEIEIDDGSATTLAEMDDQINALLASAISDSVDGLVEEEDDKED